MFVYGYLLLLYCFNVCVNFVKLFCFYKQFLLKCFGTQVFQIWVSKYWTIYIYSLCHTIQYTYWHIQTLYCQLIPQANNKFESKCICEHHCTPATFHSDGLSRMRRLYCEYVWFTRLINQCVMSQWIVLCNNSSFFSSFYFVAVLWFNLSCFYFSFWLSQAKKRCAFVCDKCKICMIIETKRERVRVQKMTNEKYSARNFSTMKLQNTK